MSEKPQNTPSSSAAPSTNQQKSQRRRPAAPLPNYTLSTVCPACGDETFRLACKVRCGRCGFMWDCSEL